MDADYLILSDRAEAVNGKLYMVGGGWDRLGLAQIPGPADFDLALGVLVGYNETNAPHQIEIVLEDEDNKTVIPAIKAQFEIGKPPGMKAGQAQRFQLVLRGPFQIPAAGAYHWVVSLDGERKTITRFWVDRVLLPGVTGPSSPMAPR